MVGFYVSVIDGPRKGFLLGPYSSHEEALKNVERGKQMSLDSDNATRSWFYGYGTCKIETQKELPKSVFGR
jgi:hypothetical protein